MKKIYLLAVIALLSSSLLAQDRATAVREAAKISAKEKAFTGREVLNNDISTTPTILQTNATSNFVGATYYDLQTNNTMPKRVVTHEDGTVGFVWTACKVGQNTSRGSGYNYYNGSELIRPANTMDRIENMRTGWPTMGALTDPIHQGEVVISHNGTTGLVVSTRKTKGTGNWTQKLLLGPPLNANGTPSTALLWPSLVTSGTTVHLVACTDSDSGYRYNGINTCLLYYRGEYDFAADTIVWSEPKIVGDVTPDYIKHFSGDSYAIAVNGDKVAILVCDMRYDNFYWLSEDGGITFGSRQLVYETALPAEIYSTTLFDETYVCDGSGAIAIDDNGIVHVALGIMGASDDDPSDEAISIYLSTNCLLYWNSTKQPILMNLCDTARYNLHPDTLKKAGYSVLQIPTLDETNTLYFLRGTEDHHTIPNYGVGGASMPQLLTDGDNVYLIYSALMQYPLVDFEQAEHYRGIFAAKSTNNGETWPDATVNGVSWLSYGRDLFLVDWVNYDTTYTENNDFVPPYLFVYSENVYPTLAANIADGKINVMWQSSLLPGKDVGGATNISSNISNIYWFSIDADSIGIYNNTREVYTGIWNPPVSISENSIKNTKIYPNPANSQVALELTSTNANTATLTITNVMGQVVMSQTENLSAGHNTINFNVSHLSKGFYLVNVNTPTGKVTQKLIIQ